MDSVGLIKERLSIVEVVGSYIKLEKAGINYKAKCPFHNEKTPSFFVSPERNSFYCFGCGEKGDIFSFVEKFEGLDFLGALKLLSERSGIPIDTYKGKEKNNKSDLYSIMEEATRYFEENLRNNKEAPSYLKGRGLNQNTIKEFRIGFSKNEWRDLTPHLRKKGFKDKEILESGLSKRPDDNQKGEIYDRFRGRIMFPINDSSGRVVAFSGRIFEEGEKGGEAKYINSPETPIFSKSKILYGYDKARHYIHKWGFTILVEGQIDLLMSHQSGFKNTVALSGTALTEGHIRTIKRLSPKLVLALDADSAGLSASGKSASLTLSSGMDVKVAHLKEGKDPADLIKLDTELWKKAIRESTHIIDFYIEVISSMGYEKRKFAQEVSKKVLPFVVLIPDSIDKFHFIKKISEKIGVSEQAVLEEVGKIKLDEKVYLEESRDDGSPQEEKIDIFLGMIISLYITEEKQEKKKIDLREVKKLVEELIGEEEFTNQYKNVTLSPSQVFEGESLYSSNDSLQRDVEELYLNFKYHFLKKEFDKNMAEIQEKEKGSGDVLHILKKCDEISKEMTKIDLLLKNK